MRKTFLILCLVCMTAGVALAESLVLPGTRLYVGNQATLAIPSKLSLKNVSWEIADPTILREDDSNNSSCTVTPLKAGETNVTASGLDEASNTTKQVSATVTVINKDNSGDDNGDNTNSSGNNIILLSPSSMVVGTQAIFQIPSSLSLTGVAWSVSDDSILKLETQTDTICVASPLKTGTITVTAVGKNASGVQTTVGPTAFTVGSGVPSDMTMGGSTKLLTVGQEATFRIPSGTIVGNILWNAPSDITKLRPVSYASDYTSCNVMPLESGNVSFSVSGTNSSGATVTLTQNCVIIDANDVLDISVKEIADKKLKVNESADIVPEVTVKLNGTPVDLPYEITAKPNDGGDKVKVEVVNGVSVHLTAKNAGTSEVTVTPLVGDKTGQSVSFKVEVSKQSGGGSPSGGGGCDAGLGSVAVLGAIAISAMKVIRKKKQ